MSEAPSGRILIVDHSRGALLFQETILRRRDAVIETSLAGSDALVRAKKDRPELVIFAFDLFDMTAPEFCRGMRDDDVTRGTSLLLVADRTEQESVALCTAAGCNDVIYRPLRRRELDAKVEKLTRIPARRQLRTMTRIELSLQQGSGRFLLGRSINVSANGMLVELDRQLPAEEGIILHFYIPGDPRPFQLDAEVVRAEFTGGLARYGVRFTAIADEERERIGHYVRRLRSRELL